MKLKVKLDDSQIIAAKFLSLRKHGVVNHITGSGKTLIQILVGFYKLSQREVDKFIIIGTKSSIIEINNDFTNHTDVVPFCITDLLSFKYFFSSEMKVAVMQYEVVRQIDIQILDSIFSLNRVVVCFDEFHKLKNDSTGITQKYKFLRKQFEFCYGFTATLITQSLYDLYYLVSFLDPSVFGGRRRFEDEFVNWRLRSIGRGRKIKEVVSYKNLDILRYKISGIVTTFFPRMEIEYVKKETQLSNWEPYVLAADGFLREERVVHSGRLVDLQRVVNEDKNKRTLFRKVIEEEKKSGVLVFCAFYTTVDLVKEELDSLGIENRLISGKQLSEERIAVKEWFIKDPENKVLIMTMAGGQSLNLQATPVIILYDVPFGIGYFKQIIGRVVRKFSKFDKFRIIIISVKRTIDEYKFELIQANKEVFVDVLEDSNLPGVAGESYCASLIKRMRKDLLWVKENSGK